MLILKANSKYTDTETWKSWNCLYAYIQRQMKSLADSVSKYVNNVEIYSKKLKSWKNENDNSVPIVKRQEG